MILRYYTHAPCENLYLGILPSESYIDNHALAVLCVCHFSVNTIVFLSVGDYYLVYIFQVFLPPHNLPTVKRCSQENITRYASLMKGAKALNLSGGLNMATTTQLGRTLGLLRRWPTTSSMDITAPWL